MRGWAPVGIFNIRSDAKWDGVTEWWACSQPERMPENGMRWHYDCAACRIKALAWLEANHDADNFGWLLHNIHMMDDGPQPSGAITCCDLRGNLKQPR